MRSIEATMEKPRRAPPDGGITRLLSYRISALSRALAREGAAIYSSKLGLTLPEWRVISALGHAGELSVTDISNRIFMDRGQTSRTVDALLKSGMIRMRPDVKNQRRTLLSLSRDGEALHAAGLPVAQERQERLMEGFSAEEIAVFEGVLDRLLDHYAADNGKGEDQ
jgi:DNA-binding MarR family transcriptional regulator